MLHQLCGNQGPTPHWHHCHHRHLIIVIAVLLRIVIPRRWLAKHFSARASFFSTTSEPQSCAHVANTRRDSEVLEWNMVNMSVRKNHVWDCPLKTTSASCFCKSLRAEPNIGAWKFGPCFKTIQNTYSLLMSSPQSEMFVPSRGPHSGSLHGRKPPWWCPSRGLHVPANLLVNASQRHHRLL